MLRSRIIPVLLVHNRGLVKTTKFKDAKYVGDPLNAVKIFNEKEADELVLLDIDASVLNNEPDYKMIENIANECRMPLCYGGGIKSAEHALRVLSLGVEKVAFSSVLFESPHVVSELSKQVGAQSVVAILDVKKKMFSSRYWCFTHNGSKDTGVDIFEAIDLAESLGVGEIVINNIDRDGTMLGYDLELISRVSSEIKVPLTCVGGAGSMQDIKDLIEQEHIIGAAAGSLFVFKGKYRAVLINYPTIPQRDLLFGKPES